MNGFDVASAVVFSGSLAYVISAVRPPKRPVSTARRLLRSVAMLTTVALATAFIALNGNLTTRIFIELTTSMLIVAAIIHAFAWSRWLEK